MSVAADRAFSIEANQAALASAVSALAERLARRTRGEAEPACDEDPRQRVPALDRIARLFGLSSFEANILLLCAAQEFDPGFGGLCAIAQGGPERGYPTFGLALALFGEGHWSALTASGPLRQWRLVDLAASDGLTRGRISIAEPVLHDLAGVGEVDPRLDGLLRFEPAPSFLPASHERLARSIAERWRAAAAAGGDLPAIELTGDDGPQIRAIASAAAAVAGSSLGCVDLQDLPGPSETLSALLRVIERDLTLAGASLLIENADPEPSDSRAARVADQMRLGLILSSRRASRGWRSRRPIHMGVARPEGEEERRVWQAALGSRAQTLNGGLDRVIGQFRLPASAIAAIGRRGDLDPGESDAAETALWRACRSESALDVGSLAERIDVRARWEDLVLPPPQRAALRGLAAQLRHRRTVYEAWGFAGRSARGLGVGALFVGPSGVGKTMAAEVVAADLDLDLYRIDLSQLVSKWLGETEKNLAKIFDAADSGGAVLLFDEADALFAKRTEVKDSHDRYANVEVSYLLQRMESYRGLAILTTNTESSIDNAFLRRLRTIIQFPFPDASQRAEIWRRVFPPRTPVEGLSPEKLARPALSGGTIRNVALTAAFLAAEAGEPVRMADLKRATEIECAKLKRPLGAAETGDWL